MCYEESSRSRSCVFARCLHVAKYPKEIPFDPSEHYPEYPFRTISPHPNPVYQGVRELFREMGLDRSCCGTSRWNPLGVFIQPGDRVVLKPNWVMHSSSAEHPIEALVTHGSVIRAVLDYALLALKGKGQIVIFDAPLMDADFEGILETSGAGPVVRHLCAVQDIPIQIVDGRHRVVVGGKYGQTIKEMRQAGDPQGCIEFDLGSDSLHLELGEGWKRFEVGKGEAQIMRQAHNAVHHKYLFPRSVLEANVVLNLPKLKTHIKAGVTLALKNMVGLIGDKSYLPHHRRGGSARGGDEYEGANFFLEVRDRAADLLRTKGKVLWLAGRLGWCLLRTFGRLHSSIKGASHSPYELKSGSWPGNDTLWRTIHDINRILLYGDVSGQMHSQQQRKYLCVMDGVMAGEGDGPLSPTPVPLGLLLASLNPVATDLACLRVMKYRFDNIPQVCKSFNSRVSYRLVDFSPGDVHVVGDLPDLGRPFVEPKGWTNVLRADVGFQHSSL